MKLQPTAFLCSHPPRHFTPPSHSFPSRCLDYSPYPEYRLYPERLSLPVAFLFPIAFLFRISFKSLFDFLIIYFSPLLLPVHFIWPPHVLTSFYLRVSIFICSTFNRLSISFLFILFYVLFPIFLLCPTFSPSRILSLSLIANVSSNISSPRQPTTQPVSFSLVRCSCFPRLAHRINIPWHIRFVSDIGFFAAICCLALFVTRIIYIGWALKYELIAPYGLELLKFNFG